MFGNQLTVIEALAKSIPVDWVVYVKEHPAVVDEVVRSGFFFERLNQLPNVILAPVYADANTLINNAEVVKRALQGEISEECPVTYLRTQSQCVLYLDQDSASLLD